MKTPAKFTEEIGQLLLGCEGLTINEFKRRVLHLVIERDAECLGLMVDETRLLRFKCDTAGLPPPESFGRDDA